MSRDECKIRTTNIPLSIAAELQHIELSLRVLCGLLFKTMAGQLLGGSFG